jgi:transposase
MVIVSKKVKLTKWEMRLAQSQDFKNRVTKLLAQGMSQTDVAKKVGVSRQRIFQITKEVAA